LELAVEMIATLEAERDAIVEDEASTHVNAKKIQYLHKLKAIGPEFAAVLVGEIFHRDFNNRRPRNVRFTCPPALWYLAMSPFGPSVHGFAPPCA
jgi:hypothetical protein